MVRDTRVQGKSYGYVVVPEGGLSVAGVKFPAGPRPAGNGRSSWFKTLVAAGCRQITQAEYEAYLKQAKQAPKKAPKSEPVTRQTSTQAGTAKETKDGRPRDAGRGKSATGAV